MNASCSANPTASKPQTVQMPDPESLPVAVIGGGPVGLAAAAHLLERGLEPVVFEADPSVGMAPRDWGHVHMFSPWRYNVDRACHALLSRHGWTAPDADSFPTGHELVSRYLEPLATSVEIAPRLRLGTKVTGVARLRTGKVRDLGREQQPFEVRFQAPEGAEGRLLARAVIVATGTWGHPSPAGASGLPAVGEVAGAARIRYGMPDVMGGDQDRYAGRRVLVVGSGHSAIGTLIDLAKLADQAPSTTVFWAARSMDLTRAYGAGAADQLPERGALGERLRAHVEAGRIRLLAPFIIDEIRCAADGSLDVRDADGRAVQVDEMVVATGLRPGLAILREARLDLDPALDCPRVLAPLIDPNQHSCGTVRPHGAIELQQPDVGLFLAGMVSYGRAPTFLLATGYEQVRSIAAYIAGDIEAARRVELHLPQTGVCSASRVFSDAEVAQAACCTPETPQAICCAPKPELVEGTPCCGTPARHDVAITEPAE
jgi:thioredoxin reductase